MDKLTILIQNTKTEILVGVATKVYVKDNEKYYDILLESGSKIFGVTHNTKIYPHIKTLTKKIEPTIQPEFDRFNEEDAEVDIDFE